MVNFSENVINHVFSRSGFKSLLNKNYHSSYEYLVSKLNLNITNKTNRDIIKEIYYFISKEYRNEYFYKNTILNKLLLGVHSINTTTALTELPVHNSKVDFVLINGKAIAYEIKTDLDNFNRLSSQVSDYYKAFRYVTVLTCEKNIDFLLNETKYNTIGIYVLTKRNTINRLREPQEHSELLNYTTIFNILRKSEYEYIIKDYYGFLPEVSQFEYYHKCREMFLNIEINKAYLYFLSELKKRYIINKTLYDTIPKELKFVSYFSELKETDYKNLNVFLNKEYGGK